MLYSLLKILVRLLRPLFFRSVRIDRPDLLRQKGPVLICANHPNSFLDAVLLDSLFSQPIWSLARGDVFKTRFITRILTAIRILPVYRVSEGVENLSTNYETFDSCKAIFKGNGLVLIFSEGLCVNEWHLRPLKKGTARLAISSWKEGIPLSILPLGINYSSFNCFGKDVVINIGDILRQEDFSLSGNEGQNIQSFNDRLTKHLQPLVYEIQDRDIKMKQQLIGQPSSLLKKILLAIPAFAGWLLHLPLYLPVKRFAVKRALHTGHFDSVLAMLLFLTYPLYLLLVGTIIFLVSGQPIFSLTALLLPILAVCSTQYDTSAQTA